MKLLSTTSLLLLASLLNISQAQAARPEQETKETIVHRTTTVVDVDLNEKTVVCSRADYAMPMLKVLIPQLDDITLLEHQNFGATAPCVTTGETCFLGSRSGKGASPDDILQGNPQVVKANVTVTEKRIEYRDNKEETCLVELVETVETEIRGKKLFHERRQSLPGRTFGRCAFGGVR